MAQCSLSTGCKEYSSNTIKISFYITVNHKHASQTIHPNTLTEKFDVIGHVPKLMVTWLLKRPSNSGNLLIKGKHGNRGGCSFEVPCEYHFSRGQVLKQLAETEISERRV